MKKVDKPYGYELWIINTDKYCGKLINIEKGHKNSLHRHHKKDETFYVLSGKIKLTVDLISMILGPEDSKRVKPGANRSFG